MSDGGSWITIVLLAMLAGFIGLRLVSVLGRRTGHENPVIEPFRPGQAEVSAPAKTIAEVPSRASLDLAADTPDELRAGIQTVAAVDPSFDPGKFAEGAQGAYRMILEAFWSGDVPAMSGLVSDEVQAQFTRAVEARRAEGVTLHNRIVRIDKAELTGAQMVGRMAEVTVRFTADIVAVTNDASGALLTGSAADAVTTHDVWTFSRHIGSNDPNWLLIATDEEA